MRIFVLGATVYFESGNVRRFSPINSWELTNNASDLILFTNKTDKTQYAFPWQEVLKEDNSPWGADLQTTIDNLVAAINFNPAGVGGVASFTATPPLTNIGTSVDPNVAFSPQPDGNYGLSFLGGVPTLVPISGETVGSYKAFPTTTIPTNYLWCNGATLLIANYPDLFAVIGNTYGGDGIVNFALPNLQGRNLQGDNGTNIGNSGGANTLNIGQLPIVNATGTVAVSTNSGDSLAANGSFFANADINGEATNGFVPNGNQGTTASITGVTLNPFGSNQPHEHPYTAVRWAMCFQSVGVNGASPTPSFNAVLGVGNDSPIRALLNGIGYVTFDEIPNFIDETSTIATFQTGETYYYVGAIDITYDYDTLPYPTPTPVQNFNFVNLSVHEVTFASNGGNANYVLKPLQALKDITTTDVGAWELTVVEYIDNIYDLQQVTQKGFETTNAIIVKNNPDNYRTRYSITGQQVQRDDLGNRVNYDDLGISLSRQTGTKNWSLLIPNISANANNTSYPVTFRPDVSGTVGYIGDVFCDFENGTSGTPFNTQSTGSAANTVLVNAISNELGTLEMRTGTTATGYSSILANLTSIVGGQGIYEREFRVYFPVLTDLVQTYNFMAGLGDSVAIASPLNGVYFRYDTASTNWQLFSVAGGVPTSVITTTAVAATTFYKLKVRYESSKATFHINGVLVGTITTNLPTGTGQLFGTFTKIGKTVGTTSRVVRVDYIHLFNQIAR